MAKSPVKPFLMTAEQAAATVVRALDTKPLRLSRPLAMATLVAALSLFARVAMLFT